MWLLRPISNPPLNISEFDGHDTLFFIKLIHGGEFTKFPEVRYKNGVVRFVDNVDIHKFSMHQMDKIMKGLGYTVPPVIYYHFSLSDGDFHFGLHALGNDDDILKLSQYVKDQKLVRIYTKHGKTNLLTYFMNPKHVKKVVIEQLGDEDEVQTPTHDREVICRPPSPPRLEMPLIISPEYKRKRSWKMVIDSFDCSMQLFGDEDDTAEKIRDVDVKPNGDEIIDMTVDEDGILSM